MTAKRCSCRRLARLLELRDSVRIPERYGHCTFDTYLPATSSQERALAEARRFAASWPHVARDLFLAGGPGVGKTHLAVAIARDLVQRFVDDVLFVDFAELLWFMLDSSCSEGQRRSEWHRARRSNLLVLDNTGMVSPSSPRVRLAGDLLAARAVAGRRTIFTSEPLRYRGLFDGRKVSRSAGTAEVFFGALSPSERLQLLGNARMILIQGEDYRKRQAAADCLFG